MCFPVLPKLADKSHKPITKGLGCCRSEAFKNFSDFFLILILRKTKSLCMCLARLCKYSSHCWSHLSLFKRKKKIILTSAHFESICPLFFKILPHTVASSAYVRIIFIEGFTVVKNKPDIYGEGLQVGVPGRKQKRRDGSHTAKKQQKAR